MRGYYDSDNFFMRWFGKLADVVLLGLLWLLCSLPLVTIGASTIALYDAIARCVHGNQDGPYKHFFQVFKAEFWRGLFLTLTWAALAFVLYLGCVGLYQWGQSNSLAQIYSVVYMGTLLIPVAIFIWAIALEARFGYGFFALHKAAATFTLIHLPTTGILLGITALAAVVTAFIPALILVTPGIVVTFHSWFIEKVFKQYLTEEESDDTAE